MQKELVCIKDHQQLMSYRIIESSSQVSQHESALWLPSNRPFSRTTRVGWTSCPTVWVSWAICWAMLLQPAGVVFACGEETQGQETNTKAVFSTCTSLISPCYLPWLLNGTCEHVDIISKHRMLNISFPGRVSQLSKGLAISLPCGPCLPLSLCVDCRVPVKSRWLPDVAVTSWTSSSSPDSTAPGKFMAAWIDSTGSSCTTCGTIWSNAFSAVLPEDPEASSGFGTAAFGSEDTKKTCLNDWWTAGCVQIRRSWSPWQMLW